MNLHILQIGVWYDLFSDATTVTNLLLSLISLLCIVGVAFVNLRMINKISLERPYTVFGYCARLQEHLKLVKFYLKCSNKTPLLYLISDDYRDQSVELGNADKLIGVVNEFFDFVRNESFQAPLNMKFQELIQSIVDNLLNVLKIGHEFPFTEKKDVMEIHESLIKSIDELDRMIKNEQAEIVKLYDKSQKSLFSRFF